MAKCVELQIKCFLSNVTMEPVKCFDLKGEGAPNQIFFRGPKTLGLALANGIKHLVKRVK
jgi:hypothetical protein